MSKYIIREEARCRVANHITADSPEEAEEKYNEWDIDELELAEVIETIQVDETELND